MAAKHALREVLHVLDVTSVSDAELDQMIIWSSSASETLQGHLLPPTRCDDSTDDGASWP